MKKRDGSRYAELISEKWPLVRSKGDALNLCRYNEVTADYIGERRVLSVTHTEEIDCIFYEVDPKNIDNEKYNQIDKLVGFPWCDISKDPEIDSIFIDDDSIKWVTTGILSSDPIKGYVELAVKPLAESDQDVLAINIDCFNTINIKKEPELLFSDMIYIRNTPTVTAQPLTQSLELITGTDHGIPVFNSLQPKARLEYSASFQVRTGASAGEADIVLQKSAQPDGLPESWSDVAKMTGPLTLQSGEEKRYTIAFHDELPSGLPAGIALKYRLVGRITDPLKTIVMHESVNIAGAPPPTVKISVEWNYLDLPAQDIPVDNTLQVTEVVAVQPGIINPDVNNSSQVSQTIEIEEGVINPVINNNAQVSQAVEMLVPDAIWFATPATPEANLLDVGVYEEVDGTTVVVPSEAAGYPNVRFSYNATISLLATGIDGGDALFKLQKSENGGGWVDIPGQEFSWLSNAQNDEERATISLYDDYIGGVPMDTEIRYRLVGQSVVVGQEVTVHESLVSSGDTSPVAYVTADFFFG